MKLAVYQVPGVSLGKHNVKDPRLDAADKLVEAKKKIYVQADIVGEDEMKDADAILVPAELKGDLVLLDMEFLELRLGREQSPEEKALFEKLYAALESEKAISELPLSDEEKALMGSYQFVTNRAIVPLASFVSVVPTVVVYPLTVVASVTLYVVPIGSPVSFTLSPPCSVTVAVPPDTVTTP